MNLKLNNLFAQLAHYNGTVIRAVIIILSVLTNFVSLKILQLVYAVAY
jgi:hypothetical protein